MVLYKSMTLPPLTGLREDPQPTTLPKVLGESEHFTFPASATYDFVCNAVKPFRRSCDLAHSRFLYSIYLCMGYETGFNKVKMPQTVDTLPLWNTLI